MGTDRQAHLQHHCHVSSRLRCRFAFGTRAANAAQIFMGNKSVCLTPQAIRPDHYVNNLKGQTSMQWTRGQELLN